MNKSVTKALEYENMRLIPQRKAKPRTKSTRVLEQKAFSSLSDRSIVFGGLRALYERHSVGFWESLCIVTWILLLGVIVK
jgi:hypothetical protein